MTVPLGRLTENERSLLQFWESRRNGRAMPARADIAAEDLFPWIGYLHLLEPIDGGNDFRYAVFTTRTLIGSDKDMTGKCVSDWGGERAGYALQLYSTVMECARPIYSVLPERYKDDWIIYSRICLPLGIEGTITHIMSMISFMEDEQTDTVLPSIIEL